MRVHLDPASTGNGVTGTGKPDQTAPAGGSILGPAGQNGLAAGADSIQLSGPTAALNRLSADRAGRIQQLTALVQAGSYQVSGSAVAGAIVGSAVS
jgi:hypothetical protein